MTWKGVGTFLLLLYPKILDLPLQYLLLESHLYCGLFSPSSGFYLEYFLDWPLSSSYMLRFRRIEQVRLSCTERCNFKIKAVIKNGTSRWVWKHHQEIGMTRKANASRRVTSWCHTPETFLSELTSARHLLVATSNTEFSMLIHHFVLPVQLYRPLSNQASPRSLCVIFGRRISGWYGNILLLPNFVAAPWQSSNVSYGDKVTFSSCQVFPEDWPHTSRWNRQRGHSGVSRACPLYSAITHSLQAARQTIEALGSDIPKTEFIDLAAGWETFTRTGVALPQETVECVKHWDRSEC